MRPPEIPKNIKKAFKVYWRENRDMLVVDNAIDGLVSNSIEQALKNVRLSIHNEIGRDLAEAIKRNLTSLTNEALAHLVLYAFLQRVLNGGADFIQREYALGRTRADICVGYQGRRYPLELKIKGIKSRVESLTQLSGYMDKCGATEGWLVVFDNNFEKPWNERLSWETIDHEGKRIHVVGC